MHMRSLASSHPYAAIYIVITRIIAPAKWPFCDVNEGDAVKDIMAARSVLGLVFVCLLIYK